MMTRGSLLAFLETRWVLLLVLVVFICCKIPHLSYPFYCDEGWVYSQGVKEMAANGPGLLPGALRGDLSRGHPLLFHFLCTSWMYVFGSSNVAIHSFALFVAVLCLVALFEGMYHMFGRRVATLALLLVCTQVIFFVQASFIELEVLVTLFTFLSLYFYCYDKLFLASLMLFGLFFTKESGLVFGAIIGLDAVIAFFTRRGNLKTRLLRIATVLAPTLLIGLFFLLQKAKFGWYILPLHTGLIHHDWETFYQWFHICIRLLFKNDPGTYALYVFIAALGFLPAVLRRKPAYLFLVPMPIIAYLVVNDSFTGKNAEVIFVVLVALMLAVSVFAAVRFNTNLSSSSRRFIILLGLCLGAYMCFSSFFTLTFRYMLVAIVLLLLLLSVCIEAFVSAGNKLTLYLALTGILVIGAYSFYADSGTDDTDLRAFDAMKVQTAVVAYLEKEKAYDVEVSDGCFWVAIHLVDTGEGYLSTRRVFKNVNWEAPGPTTIYAVYHSVNYKADYADMQRNAGFFRVFRAESREVWSEVYRRK